MATDSQTSKTKVRQTRSWKSEATRLRARLAQERNHRKMRLSSLNNSLTSPATIGFESFPVMTSRELELVRQAVFCLSLALARWDETSVKDLNPELFED